MKGKTHMASAILLAPVILKLNLSLNAIPIYIATGIGALLPDIDISNSTISNRIKRLLTNNEKINNSSLWSKLSQISVLLLLILFMYTFHINKYLIFFIAFSILNILTTHRSLSHSLLALSITYYLLNKGLTPYNLKLYAYSISLGYLIHILEDVLTPMGVPLFFPIVNKRNKIPIVRNDFSERIFLIFVFVLFLYK